MATDPAPRGPDRRPGRAGSLEGWAQWLPGLMTMRGYEARWLPRDFGAGLVLTAVLVPVGLAYAVASGLPGVCGLYATIIPLVAYALFGPSRILVLGPEFLVSGDHFGRNRVPRRWRREPRGGARWDHGDRLGRDLHRRGRRAARLHHRASLQADPLRVHERDCADRPGQSGAEADRRQNRERGAPPGGLVDRRRASWREGELGGIRAGRCDPRDDFFDQESQGSPRHTFRDRRGDGHRSDFRLADPRPCRGAGTASAGLPSFSIPWSPSRI